MQPTLLPLPNGRLDFTGESIPVPNHMRYDPGEFSPEPLAVFARRAGIALEQGSPALLHLRRNEQFPPEAYRLRITPARGIEIEAAGQQGLCWALATLALLISNEGQTVSWGEVLCCDITDRPKYAHRGILLDCVRHFFPVQAVKAFIEAISLVKLNRLHWHLSDDQGWRIESKRFPALHEQCAPNYYTQEEIRDIVDFAALRGVEIIPEIDLPGHTTSILAVMPQLGCTGEAIALGTAPGIYSSILCTGKEAVFELLLPLLEEIAALFPSPLFHLGGDEAPKTNWHVCPHCRQRMVQQQLASEEELQGWFTARLAAHLRGLGKRPICWNESLLSQYLQEKTEDLTIQYWAEMHQTGPARRFWQAGGQVIFSDMLHTYFDYPHGSIPMKTVYHYKPGMPFDSPIAAAPPALGMEACLWTEFIPDLKSLAEHAFPRAYALAEAAWTNPSRKHYGEFCSRLEPFLERFPGPGFTPPEQADPHIIGRYRQRIAFSHRQATAPKPEHNGGLGGRLAPDWALHWLGHYLR